MPHIKSAFNICLAHLLLVRLIYLNIFLIFVLFSSLGISSCTSTNASKNEIRQEIEQLKNTSKSLQSSDLDSAIFLQQKALKLAHSLHDKQLKASVLSLLGTSYSIQMNLDKSDSCNMAAIRLLSLPEATDKIANIYCNLGINQSKRSHLDSALALYRHANELAAKLDSPEILYIRTYNNIGLVYNTKGKYDSAMVYLHKVFELAEKMEDADGMGNALLNMGNCSYYMKNPQQSSLFYQKADSCYTASNNLMRLMQVKNNHTSILTSLQQYDKALETSMEAERLAREMGILSMLGAIYNNRGELYYRQKQFDKCIDLQQKSFEIKKQFRDTVGFIHYYESLSAIYFQMKQFDEAKQLALQGLKFAEQKKMLQKMMN